MTIKKTLSVLLAIVMIGTMFTSLPFTVNAVGVDTATIAAGTVKDVGSAEELSAVCTEINTNGGEYTINLTADITGGNIDINNANAVVTVIGNGNTITRPNGGSAVTVSNGATVNLGDGNTALTISSGTDGDEPGIVYILSNSVCNMNKFVTLKDHKGNNYFGGGVTVEGGTFHMNGGTIENCGIDGGSVCYGGGVAVINGGTFVMDGGTITGCYAKSDYIDDLDPNRCFTAIGGGVFVSNGAAFTMNGGTISNCEATNFGGGAALDICYEESQSSGLGNPKSKVTINGGSITGNNADCGAGIFASGYFYSYASKFYGYTPAGGVSANPGLYINGGSIEQNIAEDMGGGILIAMLRPAATVQIHNAAITENTADNGAGIESFGYWTQTDIDGCTITDNTAVTNGGGILLSNNSSGGFTSINNTTITGNTSGDRGAGVYYDAASEIRIAGADVIQNNKYNGKQNNLNILSLEKPVKVIGDLTGSQIGLSDPTLWDDGKTDEDASAVSTEYLTSGYKEYNPEVHPDKYFTSDHETWFVDRSVKTTTTQPDTSSKVRRVYSAKKYTAVLPNTAAYAGHQNQYVITDIQNPDLQGKKITSITDIVSELIYRYDNDPRYKIGSTNVRNTNYYIKYEPEDSNTSLSTIVLQKTSSNNYATVTYNALSTYYGGRGGNVVYTASPTIQSTYANSGELVLQITSPEGNFSNYTFSDDYTETTVEYVNANPQGNVIYEYDEYSDVIAKYVIDDPTDCSEIQAQITVETGTDSEVRLVRRKTNYHINNDVIDDNYGNDDIFTDEIEAATGTEVKHGDPIERFYTIPEVTPTNENSCPYIFKGWYYDPVKEDEPVEFGTDVYLSGKDIYAHWITVENVTKDEEDTNILPKDETEYGGFDLAGVQIRDGIIDSNFEFQMMPGGLRFMTSLSKEVVREINEIKPNNIEYGYVAATSESWIEYHKGQNNKLLYVSDSANGINTTKTTEKDEDYFGFAQNVVCTSKQVNSRDGLVNKDHHSYDDYLLYTLVITYEDDDGTGLDKNVLARPYIRYIDANGSERVAYSEYRGTNTLGGCSISYNGAKAITPAQ